MTIQEYTKTLGINLTPEQISAFGIYQKELMEWNEKFNLTAIKTPDEITLKHFVDSLTIIPHIPEESHTIVDVGSGAGFPGLAIKIARPDMKITLLESTGKKVTFLDHIIATLKLPYAETIKIRAEEAGHNKKLREKFDVVTARAVAYLPVLAEYMLPLVKVGGICIAQKTHSESEVNDARHAINILGGKIKEIIPITIPGLESHELVIIEKVFETENLYPRTTGIPTKDPL
ncbi:MAG: 16S rRNA (guanine(527)-N(7))-methyltransferase RsmG [Candidatus Paceibacterota bacterium]|jgi:16S rRNA (guanine527-N7)-methyltransferase